jgi:hypothetical protein
MGQWPSRLALLLIPLVFACFALAQSAQAVTPEADGGYPNGDTAEEDSALLDLSTDAESAAMAQAAKDPTPNHREITINWLPIPIVPCAFGSEKVDLRGILKLAFRASGGTVRPVQLELQRGFSGTCPSPKPSTEKTCLVGIGQETRRRYVARELRAKDVDPGTALNGVGIGTFKVRVQITSNPPPKPDPFFGKEVRFNLLYHVTYGFSNGKVTFFKTTRDICCPQKRPRSGCD